MYGSSKTYLLNICKHLTNASVIKLKPYPRACLLLRRSEMRLLLVFYEGHLLSIKNGFLLHLLGRSSVSIYILDGGELSYRLRPFLIPQAAANVTLLALQNIVDLVSLWWLFPCPWDDVAVDMRNGLPRLLAILKGNIETCGRSVLIAITSFGIMFKSNARARNLPSILRFAHIASRGFEVESG